MEINGNKTAILFPISSIYFHSAARIDSKAALKEAITRPSERLSPLEL
jgi:hypothetical protein